MTSQSILIENETWMGWDERKRLNYHLRGTYKSTLSPSSFSIFDCSVLQDEGSEDDDSKAWNDLFVDLKNVTWNPIISFSQSKDRICIYKWSVKSVWYIFSFSKFSLFLFWFFLGEKKLTTLVTPEVWKDGGREEKYVFPLKFSIHSVNQLLYLHLSHSHLRTLY